MTADTSIQLYTLRDAAAADFRAVLMRLGAIGYVGVELAGFNGLTPSELRGALDDAGLTLSSAHVDLAKPDEFEAALDEHQALGCDTVVVPMLPPKGFADLDAIRIAADRLNAANERARARGLDLGYHNHFWELPLVDDRPALLHLFDLVDDTVFAEVDIYWARVGGVDPAELVARARCARVAAAREGRPRRRPAPTRWSRSATA